MPSALPAHGTFISNRLSALQPVARPPKRFRLPAGSIHRPRSVTVARSSAMLDIAYLVIGGLFLGAFVLYALACDRL
jgi:hypothetical protein